MSERIKIDGKEISIKSVNDQDYISLTDMAKQREDANPKFIVRNWLRNNNTLLFLNAWELQNNPNFKVAQMGTFRLDVQDNSRMPSVQRYIEMTDAIGIISKSGRYGGTFAQRDIAFEFATWLSPVFKLNLITEFQRLKAEEAKRLNEGWDIPRFLVKGSLSLQNEAISRTLANKKAGKDKEFVYANEADVLNKAVFGMTAKQFREQYPDAQGNQRDNASTLELIVLDYLSALNSHFILQGARQDARIEVLIEFSRFAFETLEKDTRFSLEA
ncbi:MAG: KilA-N domain-containing protein [Bacteroidota bacterium]